MPFLKHDKNNLAIGLSWNQLTQKSVSAEAINLSEHEGSPYGVIHKTKSEEGLTSFLGLSSSKADTGKIPAAVVFSTVVENGMIIDKASEKEAWWCASIGNQILTQTDSVYDIDDITNPEHGLIQFIEEALPEIVSSDDEFVIYAHPDLAELIQDIVGETQVISMSLSDLISDTNTVNFPKSFNKYKIKKIGGTHPIVLVGLMAVALGSSYYFFFYDPAPDQVDMDMSGLSQLKESSNRVTDLVRETPPSEKDKEILLAAFDEEKQWLEYDLKRYQLATMINKALDLYETMPYLVSGWQINKIIYDKSRYEDAILVTWKKVFGSANDFNKYWDVADLEIQFGFNGNTATIIVPIQDEGSNTDSYQEKYENYKSSEFNYFNLMSFLDAKGFEWDMGIAPEKQRRQSIEGLFNKDLENQKQLKIVPYNFTVRGFSGVDSLSYLKELSNKTDLITASMIEIDISSEFKWVLKGELNDVK